MLHGVTGYAEPGRIMVVVGPSGSTLNLDLLGLATGYTDVWEHSGGERRIVVDWSPIIEDLYSPELGSACVDVMSTLHGSAPSLRRPAEGCVSPEGSQFRSQLSLESHSWRRVGGRLIKADSYPSSDNREFSPGSSSGWHGHDETIPHASQTAQTRPPGVSLGTPFHLVDHYETIPPPTVTVPPPMVPIEDTRLAEQEAKVERLESMMRQIRLQDGGLTWDDRDGIPIHLRLYSTVMRAHGIDDAQLVALFPMSLSGAAQRRELEATRQRSDESISSFVTRWRAKVAGMIDRPKEQDQIDMVLRNLQPRQLSVLRRPLLEDYEQILLLPLTASYSQSSFLSSTVSVSAGLCSEPYIAQTSVQPRPPHPRAATHPLPRPYAQRPARQFTPLGMTLTRAFEKLRDIGVIVPLAPRPLPHPIPPHFRLHEHCLYHQISGHDTEHCSALHHAIQDLIDSGVVDLARPSVTTNPLPTHSTHAVPPPPGLQ
ncbi:hypothetical protein CK203_060591 [Vitis vinifera]|uniref:Retrotransposon gag domain-containing protein n=1 Tax=Vitis vinifera TaxID=29760 RepID=A0A438FTS7_VITVI|nr:hypothetical protein CK203_060591 [Vitis vinifera]